MIYRFINGVYRRLVLPNYTKSCIKLEQENEEKLVLQNIPSNSLTALTGNEKDQVRKMYGKIFGGGQIRAF